MNYYIYNKQWMDEAMKNKLNKNQIFHIYILLILP